jgi:signal transduction histidine kinase
LLKITGELLNMSQVETGKIQLKLELINPYNIVQQAIQAVQFQAQQKHIHIHPTVADGLPFIQADVEKTSWVLINFLTNAIKYSPEQSNVEVSAFQKQDKVEFVVCDHGKGIDEKYLSRVFEKYFKVPGTHDRDGSGLGLSISKEFIEAQGGHVWVDSRIGEGSQFGFYFSSTLS